jgi:hypothetical protein
LLFFIFIVIPLLGALWFANLVVLLQKLVKDKRIYRQVVLGVTLTFVFIGALMVGIVNITAGY